MVTPAAQPENVGMDVPSIDGTLLRLTLHPDEKRGGAFTGDSLVEVQRHTTTGLRPVVSYHASHLTNADWSRPLGLHDGDPGLAIDGTWRSVVMDWASLMCDASLDIWGKEPWS